MVKDSMATKSHQFTLSPQAEDATGTTREIKGRIKSTVSEIVSYLKGPGAGKQPDDLSFIKKGGASENPPQFWRDWRWQLRHAIRDISTVEQVLGIRFQREEREQLQKTIDTFPLNITPYYLSLIDVDDYAHDPIFRQAFPSPKELTVEHYERADPLAEERTAPAPASPTGIPIGCSSSSAIPAQCIAGIAQENEKSAIMIQFPARMKLSTVSNISETPPRSVMSSFQVAIPSCSVMNTWTGSSLSSDPFPMSK